MKDTIRRLRRGAYNFYQREFRGDHPLMEAKRWKRAGGVKLLYEFPLGPDSVVLDIGGHVGGFSAAMAGRYDSHVHIFEPVSKFHRICSDRFVANAKVHSHKFGLGGADGNFPISDANEASSLFAGDHSAAEVVEVREASRALADLNLDQIDLLKINIEGAEYEVLPALIDAGILARCNYLLIQFHTIGDWVPARQAIRDRIAATHDEMWCYDFVWEAWKRRD